MLADRVAKSREAGAISLEEGGVIAGPRRSCADEIGSARGGVRGGPRRSWEGVMVGVR